MYQYNTIFNNCKSNDMQDIVHFMVSFLQYPLPTRILVNTLQSFPIALQVVFGLAVAGMKLFMGPLATIELIPRRVALSIYFCMIACTWNSTESMVILYESR